MERTCQDVSRELGQDGIGGIILEEKEGVYIEVLCGSRVDKSGGELVRWES